MKKKLLKHLHAFSSLIYKASKVDSKLLIFSPFLHQEDSQA